MVRLSLKLLIASFFVGLMVFGLQFLLPGERAQKQYHELVNRVSGEGEEEHFLAKQERKNVTKELFYSHKGSDREARIVARDSRLVVEKEQKKSSFREEMDGVTCLYQEEVFYKTPEGKEVIIDEEGNYRFRKGGGIVSSNELSPMQRVRQVIADHAIYYFDEEMLEAERPFIKEYLMSGHHLPSELKGGALIMSGIASSVTVSFQREEISLEAKRLKAKVFPRRRI